MGNLNKVQLIGEVVSVFPSEITDEGIPYVKILLKTRHTRANKITHKSEEVEEVHRLVFYNLQCKRAKECINLHALIYFEGYIKSRKKIHEPAGIEEWKTELIATNFQILANPKI